MPEELEQVARAEEFEFVGFRLSWGAIIAGLVVAVVVQIILSMVGLAVGFGAIGYSPGQGMGGIGIGAGIWAVLTAMISLFAGGLAAGHFAGVLTRLDGVLHGVLVWGLSVIVALWALSAGVSTLLGGMFGVAGQTLAATIGGVSQVGAAAAGRAGIPRVPATDGEQEIAAILEQQGLSPEQARQTAQRIHDIRARLQLQAEQMQQRAPQVAEAVAGTVSTAIWWILLGMLLSLGAAAGGAALTAEG